MIESMIFRAKIRELRYDHQLDAGIYDFEGTLASSTPGIACVWRASCIEVMRRNHVTSAEGRESFGMKPFRSGIFGLGLPYQHRGRTLVFADIG